MFPKVMIHSFQSRCKLWYSNANTQTLVQAISNYKAASKTVKGLEAQSKPKAAKAKAKAAAKPEPWRSGQRPKTVILESQHATCA